MQYFINHVYKQSNTSMYVTVTNLSNSNSCLGSPKIDNCSRNKSKWKIKNILMGIEIIKNYKTRSHIQKSHDFLLQVNTNEFMTKSFYLNGAPHVEIRTFQVHFWRFSREQISSFNLHFFKWTKNRYFFKKVFRFLFI